jgi:hypothetical protein
LQQQQSETPVKLMRGETHPMLPELPSTEPPARVTPNDSADGSEP